VPRYFGGSSTGTQVDSDWMQAEWLEWHAARAMQVPLPAFS